MLSISAYCTGIKTMQVQKFELRQQIAIASGSQKVRLLLELAVLNSDSLQKADALANEALQYACQFSDKYWISRSYTSIASIKQMSGSPKDTVASYLQKAEKGIKEIGQNTFYPEYYYEKAKYYFRTDDVKTATATARLAITTSEAQKNLLILANTYLLMARIDKKQGNSSGFVEKLMKAEKAYLQCPGKAIAGRALITIGLLYNDAGMWNAAQKTMVRATRLCEQTSDSLYLAYLYCNTSGVYKTGPNSNQNYIMLLKAVAIFKKLRNDKGLGYAQNMLGLYYLDLKNYNEAYGWFLKTIQSKKQSGDWQGACFAACNIADMNLELKKYEPVVAALTMAKTFVQNAGDKLSEIVYYNTLGRFNLLDKDYTEASVNLNKSLVLASQTGDANYYLQNLKAISEVYQAAGNESKALDYYRRYSESGDSVRNANKPLQEEEIKNELSTDELIAQAVNEKKNQKVKSPSVLLTIITIAAIVLLISLSTSAFGNNPKKQKHHKSDNNKSIKPSIYPEKETVIKLNEHIQQSIWERIEHAMVEKKYFLRQDLTLHELASLLETNTLYISRIINARTGQNFNSFVNQYRIDEACKLLLADTQQLMSIEGIALTCGFKSKSAFNAAFRKLKGTTPTAFIEEQKKAV